MSDIQNVSQKPKHRIGAANDRIYDGMLERPRMLVFSHHQTDRDSLKALVAGYRARGYNAVGVLGNAGRAVDDETLTFGPEERGLAALRPLHNSRMMA